MKKPLLHLYHRLPERERRSFVLETLRNPSEGLEQTLSKSLVLLVAIQWFDVSDALTTIISAAPYLGFIAALAVPDLHRRLGISTPKMAASVVFIAGICLGFSAFSSNGVLYTLFTGLFLLLFNVRKPLLTALYEDRFHPSRRATLFSFGVLLSILTALLSNWISGQLLDSSLDHFRGIFLVFSLIFVLSALCLYFLPRDRLEVTTQSLHPLKLLRLPFEYPVFGYILLAWFITGFANLWCLPLRVVYLAEAERGLGMSPRQVVFLLGVLPALTQLVFNFVWARVFDRINFVLLRILLNFFLMFGLLFFFISENPGIIAISSVMMNICFAGTPFIWNLWVTRIAPPGRSGEFMAVHTFLTGIRGVFGPILGFGVLAVLGIRQIGIISAGLIFLSSLMLIPLVKRIDPTEKENSREE